ncbi:MAG: ABC transporter permease [Deltaproteobacteria bacterium]|nr:ABC transporter permease [Deltaproteobacteria bacterium]
MFWKMIKGSFFIRRRAHLLTALTVALGVSLAAALLGVMFDIGDKVNKELKSYGANLNAVPKGASVIGALYELGDIGQSEMAIKNNYILEDELYKIKMIFWAYNIVDFAPYLTVKVKAEGFPTSLIGSWFNKSLDLPTGEKVVTGMDNLKSWWVLEGERVDERDIRGILVGRELANKLNLKLGSTIKVTPEVIIEGEGNQSSEPEVLTVRGIFESGGDEDDTIFASLILAQKIASKPGLVERVEISALTTPDNELARRAAQNPGSLSRLEWDTWYCTAYISSIAYQIEEILPSVRVKPILKVAQSEGAILEKTELLIILLTVLTLGCASLAISNLVTANIMERSVEIGLLKALGATNISVSVLFLAETLLAALAGGVLGYVVGLALSQLVGLTVFGSYIAVKPLVIPLALLMVIFVTLLGSLPALKALTSLKPAEVLHGR